MREANFQNFSKRRKVKICLIVLLSALSLCLPAQNLSGTWEGTITQDEGGYRTDYQIEVYLLQKNNKISGRSIVSVDDIFAEMKISGDVHSGIFLQMHDTEIVEFSKIAGMEWCLKQYQLIFKQSGEIQRLEGFWQGAVSFGSCVPGKVFLKRKVPRA